MASQNAFNFSQIEAKWREEWDRHAIYSPQISTAKRPYYNLMMFPYPSAEGLHVGNTYAFTGADIFGRYIRMKGYDVFEPIGLDGFGIHSENYALKIGKHPAELAKRTQARFYGQLRLIGNCFDWTKTLQTYDPGYYQWTQWLFVRLFKSGLAYREKAPVNWCPSCKTVLADEQVIAGACERCGTEVEAKKLEQWFFRLASGVRPGGELYAESLLNNLEKIDWSERVKIAQKNWIGRHEGARVEFKINSSKLKIGKIEAFTTRLDTIFGATFVVVAPEVAKDWLDSGWKAPKEVSEYIKTLLNKSEQQRRTEAGEKTGVDTAIVAINPSNGKKIPVWVADYVMKDVGTGVIMGVPAHDERDFEFAKKYKLAIKEVIEPVMGEKSDNEEFRRSIVALVVNPKTGKVLSINWGEKDGGNLLVGGGLEEGEDPIKTAEREIKEETGYKNLKFIGKTEKIHHHYFASSKNVARIIEAVGLYFELENGETGSTKLEKDELGKFKVEWVDSEKMEGLIRDELHRYVFEKFLRGRVYTGEGILFDSGKYSGLTSSEAVNALLKDLGSKAKRQTIYHLRDWLISRQRYWGPPIPMIYCQACAKDGKSWFDTEEAKQIKNLKLKINSDWESAGWYAVDEKDLPVVLPYIKDYQPKGTGEAPLASDKKFMKVKCPQCGEEARRETDVSDTFLDSAWYYLRYPSINEENSKIQIPMTKQSQSPNNKNLNRLEFGARNLELPWNQGITRRWLPVEMYIGGAEHAVLHLLYSRFMAMAMKDLGYIDFEEPFSRFYAHGLLISQGAKMSKSRGNVVVPDVYIKKYGADTLRAYLMFLGPFDAGGDFRDTGIKGMRRFIDRVWKLVSLNREIYLESAADATQILVRMHQTIKKVTEDIEKLRYNTAISAIMEFVNVLYEKVSSEQSTVNGKITDHRSPTTVHRPRCAEWDEALKVLTLILAPFTPFLAEELWVEVLNQEFSVHTQAWPAYKKEVIKEKETTVVVTVNGKPRGELRLASDMAKNREQVETLAKKEPNVAKWLQETKLVRTIFVPGRLINFVTK
jgi:leucyl-tRNA synthetase